MEKCVYVCVGGGIMGRWTKDSELFKLRIQKDQIFNKWFAFDSCPEIITLVSGQLESMEKSFAGNRKSAKNGHLSVRQAEESRKDRIATEESLHIP